MTVDRSDLQYLYCAVCLELQDLDRTPELAITISSGIAVCEEHRRRVDGFTAAVRAARRHIERGNNNYDRKYKRP